MQSEFLRGCLTELSYSDEDSAKVVQRADPEDAELCLQACPFFIRQAQHCGLCQAPGTPKYSVTFAIRKALFLFLKKRSTEELSSHAIDTDQRKQYQDFEITRTKRASGYLSWLQAGRLFRSNAG
jgi:hypothetical protein